MTEHEKLLIAARYQPTTVGNMALDPRGGYCNYQAVEILRQRVAELEKEAKQLRDLQYELMRSGALVAIEKCKNATGQRRVIDMYVSANQIAEDLLNAMDSVA